jgi:hypothetical protein
MSSYSVTGKLHEIFDEQQVSATFTKREFVLALADNPQYPQYVSFVLVKDKTRLLDGFRKGDEISVEFNLRGREWTSPQGDKKYFNTLEAWRLGNASPAGKAAKPASNEGFPPPVDVNNATVEDDLPF